MPPAIAAGHASQGDAHNAVPDGLVQLHGMELREVPQGAGTSPAISAPSLVAVAVVLALRRVIAALHVPPQLAISEQSRHSTALPSHATYAPRNAGLKSSRARNIDLSGNSLTEVPASLLPTSLTALSLLGNRLRSIDEDYWRLKSLQHICVAANEITDISPLFSCPSLLHLNACHNRVAELNVGHQSVRPRRPRR